MEMQVGGAETHVLELAKELNRRNHQVYVMSAGGKYAEILKNEGISHMYAPLKDKKPANMMKSYQLIKQIVKDKNIEVVHAHARIPAFIAGKACKSLKIPFVTTVHGIYKVNFLLKCLSNWGQKTLAVSEDIKDQIVRDYQLDPANVGITVNGINTQEFCKGYQSEIAKELGIAKEKFHIIHVSRLDKESSNLAKMLVHVFDNLTQKTSREIQLIIVGDGNDFETVKALANNHRDIILTGLRTDVGKILTCSDVFVGVSRSALEAMSCEVPVILAGNKDYGQGFIGIFEENKK